MGKVTLIHLSHRCFANGSAQHPLWCCLRFGAAERSPRWGSVARREPSGAGAPGVVRRSGASRRFWSICKRLVFRLVKNFYVLQHKKLQKYLVSSQKMPNFALAFGNEATKIEKNDKNSNFFHKKFGQLKNCP